MFLGKYSHLLQHLVLILQCDRHVILLNSILNSYVDYVNDKSKNTSTKSRLYQI